MLEEGGQEPARALGRWVASPRAVLAAAPDATRLHARQQESPHERVFSQPDCRPRADRRFISARRPGRRSAPRCVRAADIGGYRCRDDQGATRAEEPTPNGRRRCAGRPGAGGGRPCSSRSRRPVCASASRMPTPPQPTPHRRACRGRRAASEAELRPRSTSGCPTCPTKPPSSATRLYAPPATPGDRRDTLPVAFPPPESPDDGPPEGERGAAEVLRVQPEGDVPLLLTWP